MKKKANYILAIGIDEYEHLNKLNNSKADVRRLIDVLESKYGFTTICEPLYNQDATFRNIHAALDSSTEPRVEENATLIIYFAGHGCEMPKGKGRWVPYDGTGGIVDTISHEDVLAYVKMNNWAQHIIVISDSCFSGTITNSEFPIQRGKKSGKDNSTSRIAISAGRLEPVGDGSPGYNSPFSKTLCDFLEMNTKPVISIHEVINRVKQLTPSRSYQTPQATSIECDKNEHGELLLSLESIRNDKKPEPLIFPEYLTTGPFFSRMLKKEVQADQVNTYLPRSTVTGLIDGIDSFNHIAVIGEAGSGKSRELIEATKLIEDNHPYLVPYFAKLGGIHSEQLLEEISSFANEYGQERSVLFLDGLDEVSIENWDGIVSVIMNLCKQFPLAKFVVGCRTNRYNLDVLNPQVSTLPGFMVLEMPNFQAEDIDNILKALNISQQGFYIQVNAQHFHDLISRPYSLFQLTNYYQEHGNLSIARSFLNQQALESNGVTTGSETDHFLQAIAFSLTETGASYAQTKDLSAFGFDLSLLSHQSILIRDENSESWNFIHKNFQEYLSAKFLSNLNVEDIIEVIEEDRLNGKGISPVWFNTVSYLFNIAGEDLAQQLIAWSSSIDALSLLKFEASRLSIDMRAEAYQKIYDSYLKQDLYMMSNRFTSNELGQFASNKISLELMINAFRSEKTTGIGIMNHVHVLYYVALHDFPKESDEIKFYLSRLLGDQRLEPNDRLAIINLFVQKKLLDDGIYAMVIDKYQKNNNAYHRAMIYDMIKEMRKADEQIPYLLEGIELLANNVADTHRDDTNLADEEVGLFSAITSIDSVEGLEKLIEGFLVNEGQHLSRLCYYHRDAFIKILGVFRQMITTHPGFVSNVIKLYLGLHSGYHSDFLEDCARTFFETKTVGPALMEIWIKHDLDEYDLAQVSTPLLTLESVEDIAQAVIQEEISIDRGRMFHQLLYNLRTKFPDYLPSFEFSCSAKHDFYSERPDEIDWALIREKEKVVTLDLLTKQDAIIEEVMLIFQDNGGGSLSSTQINELSSSSFKNPEATINPISYQLLYHICRQLKSDIDLESVLQWISGEKNLIRFQLTRLNSMPDISGKSFSAQGLSYIHSAMKQFPADDELFWSLTQKRILEIDEGRLLSLTASLQLPANNRLEIPSQLEKIQSFVETDKMNEQICKNINENLSYPVWLNNAAYALRNKLQNCHALILESLLKQSEHSQQDELLHLWIKNTKDFEGVKNFATQTNSLELVIASLKILSKFGQFPDYVQTRCLELIEDETIVEYQRQRLINLLIEENHPAGLKLLWEYLDSKKQYDVRYANFSKVSSLEALPNLIKLLNMSQRPPFNDPIINGLENEVLRALSNIAKQSIENGLAVKNAVEVFIDENVEEFPKVKALRYRLEFIEEETLTANRKTKKMDQVIALIHKYKQAPKENN